MMGKPLVSTELNTGTTYINVHSQTGLVVPPADSAALKKALDFLFANPSVAAKLGRNALQRYEDVFTANAMGSAYAALYKKIVLGEQIEETEISDLEIESLKKSQSL
jgi:rhamnosyl/mannosyltransferase